MSTAVNNDNLTITIGKAYAWISEAFGKDAAENITALTTAQQEQHLTEKALATKDDVTKLQAEIATVKTELKAEIANVKAELQAEIADVKAELKEDIANVRIEIATVKAELQTEIANAKSEMIKWMFIFWVGQLAAMFGLLYFFFKK